MSAFVLSFHASYGCRERGACCTSGWPIPVESASAAAIKDAMHDGRMPALANAFTFPDDAPEDTPALLGVHDHQCVFHRPRGSHRCEIQRALGHGALPLACRQFPRVSVHEPRGTSITLSHYCPTAKELLEADASAPTAIVESAPGFPADGEYVGLDTRDSLPPLLRPGMLMDWVSWWLFEREAVALIARAVSPAHALGQLGSVVNALQVWNPVDGSLESSTRAAFERAHVMEDARGHSSSDLLAAALDAVPPPWRSKRNVVREGVNVPGPDVRLRYLAAHAFANWTAHLGNGIESWLRSIEAADALLEAGMSIAGADLVLRHLVDPNEFARRLDALD